MNCDRNEAKLIADFEKNGTTTPSDENDPFSDESFKNVNQKELNDAIGYQGDQDKDYIRFLTRVALAKDQILRYARWQDNCILWEHSKEQLSKKDVPNCLHCGAPRQFEFQILPQLIFYLQVDTKASISKIQDKSCEWGTLVIYTCSQSCDLQGDYVEEFCYRQSPYTGN
jgi:pre-rRNA-processing protein TSR4